MWANVDDVYDVDAVYDVCLERVAVYIENAIA